MSHDGRVKRAWDDFYLRVLKPIRPGPTQLRETRRAFYAGVEAMLSINLAITDLSDDAGVTELELVHEELREFVKDIKAGKA